MQLTVSQLLDNVLLLIHAPIRGRTDNKIIPHPSLWNMHYPLIKYCNPDLQMLFVPDNANFFNKG
jgi:hypothetical protein